MSVPSGAGRTMDESHQSPLPVPVCGIGASAGGVEALQQFFSALRPDLGIAYVVIIHLAPDRKSELPAILSRWTAMPVLQVGDHDEVTLAPNHVYVIAPDRKLVITETSIGALPFDQPRGQRTAIDLFFRSLAETHGDGFAVLLSGTGSDGAVGARAVKERGGLILVQDPSEAAHSAMPRAAIATGVADLVLPVRELAAQIAELAHHKDSSEAMVRASEGGEAPPVDEEIAIKSVLDTLRKRTGHDFSKYKRATILRRMARRMQLAHQPTVADYLKYLRVNVAEVHALFNDLLISVTTFFRDPDAWAALEKEVIEPLVDEADHAQPLRIWVPGCATGEEAYSLAILLEETFERRKMPAAYTIFASDVDESALAFAREGSYPQAISADVSDARLERYFRRDEDHLRVAGDIRDHLVFASHSVLRDPPFAKLHLISCRNVLIYLDRELQEQMMSVFRYACRDDAFLFLGLSESADEDSFQPIDNKHRIFRARPRDDGTRPLLPDILVAPVARFRSGRDIRPMRPTGADLHAALLEEVAPPSVVVDERWTVLHISSSVSRFFQQAGGPLARRLTELVRPELRDDVHAVLQHASEGAEPRLSSFVPVQFNGAAHNVAVLAQQRLNKEEGRREILVTFLDVGRATADSAAPEPEPTGDQLRSMREQVRQAEHRMETMRDDHRLTTEDLRSANEELQSLNEEYRSTTEELETSKEELQSMNEELHTVNHELKVKLEEVSRANNDLENLMSATNVATVFLDADLRIKRFTPQLGEIFKVKSRDLDRPIGDLKHSLDYDVEEDARRVLATGQTLDREVTDQSRKYYVTRLSPYRTSGGRDIDGVVATFIDVTAIKGAESALRASDLQLEAELNVMRRLHEATLGVATAPTTREALELLLPTAISLHGADFGNVQFLDEDTNSLRIMAQHGFSQAFLDRFASVGSDDDSACGRVLRTRGVVQIGDVTLDPHYAAYRGAAAEAGFRAVQSTPLLGRDGTLVGVLSVHFREPHAFTERDRQLGDLFGRQAADLIETRAHQDNLQQLNQVLQRRTEELEASRARLSEQAEDLRKQDRHREEFLAALGHELRNPMAAIQSSLALLAVSDDRSRRALSVLTRQTLHMTRLVNDLLDATRVRHGRVRLQRQPTEVSQAIRAAVETVRERADRRGLKLECDLPNEPVYVNADPERLAQILDNLLRNALAYTDQGTVSLAVTRGESFARITVRDTGIGLAPDETSELFEPYRRGGESERSEGLGLGLALVKGLVEAHGGSIAAHSEGPGRGSEFSFTMPLSTIQPPATASSDAVAAPRRRRVLVVDDQPDVADMFASLLQALGQDVSVAYEGGQALTLAREYRPHLAFLDVAMPGMSGAEVAKRLREMWPVEALTLVAVSGHDKAHLSVRNGAFDHYLLKPVTKQDVVTLLNSLPVPGPAST